MEGMEGAAGAGMDSGSSGMDTGVSEGTSSEFEAQGGEEGEGEGGSSSSNSQAQSQKSIKQQLRELGEQDMDALVRLKVNGKEKTLSVRDAIKQAQLGEGAQARMQEAAQLRKQAQGLVELARQNPKAFFQQLGMDPYQFAESTMAERLEMLSMTPEQKRIRELEDTAKKYEQERTSREEQEKQTRTQREEHQAMQSLDREMTEAFKESGLPRHPFYVQQIAAALLAADNQGSQLTAREAADMIKTRFHSHTREIFEGLDADAIRSILGDGVLKKLRQAEVARVTGKAAPTANSGSQPGARPQAKTSQGKPQVVNEKGWRSYLETLKK